MVEVVSERSSAQEVVFRRLLEKDSSKFKFASGFV
jgi:hypothetical protein